MRNLSDDDLRRVIAVFPSMRSDAIKDFGPPARHVPLSARRTEQVFRLSSLLDSAKVVSVKRVGRNSQFFLGAHPGLNRAFMSRFLLSACVWADVARLVRSKL